MTLEDLIDLTEIQFGKRAVSPQDHFINDLQAESLDMVNLVAAIEDRSGLVVPEEDLVRVQTVADLFQIISALSRE
jgi:acyl carrier protein